MFTGVYRCVYIYVNMHVHWCAQVCFQVYTGVCTGVKNIACASVESLWQQLVWDLWDCEADCEHCDSGDHRLSSAV